MIKIETWGLKFGRWHVTWFDLWERKWCFEVIREPKEWL